MVIAAFYELKRDKSFFNQTEKKSLVGRPVEFFEVGFGHKLIAALVRRDKHERIGS